ncbi:MAG: sulfatase-like hydrolase/transferase [Bryobacterales bacterium]|nr:sulfatase-like hydrolase/transferase [Bryobacterales bacterium]
MSLSNSRGTSLGFRASTCLLASAAIVPGSGANAQPDRANAVFMLADDLGYGSISWYDGDIRAPNMDSVAHNCVGFVSGYVTAPVCNPSRPFMLDREGPGSGRVFGGWRQGGPHGGRGVEVLDLSSRNPMGHWRWSVACAGTRPFGRRRLVCW